MLWMAGVTAGIVAGLWMASMTYFCVFCLVAPRRFAAWESCLVGFAVSAVLLGAIIATDRGFLPSSVRAVRQLSRFLFEDLTGRQAD
jgi:uncharacterized membrane-anchored protein